MADDKKGIDDVINQEPMDIDMYMEEIAPLVEALINKCKEKKVACMVIVDDGAIENGHLAESVVMGGEVAFSPAIDILHGILVELTEPEKKSSAAHPAWISRQVGTA